jgi:hypothetical protein
MAPFARVERVVMVRIGAVEEVFRVGLPFVAGYDVVVVGIPASGRLQLGAFHIRDFVPT